MSLSALQKTSLALRALEFQQMPGGFRRALVKGFLPNPYARMTQRNGKELIFVHVPKTAGTSLADALGVQCGHIPISRYHAFDPARFQKAYKFAFVRNPWERLRSAFSYLHSAIGINNSLDVLWATEYLGEYANFEDFVLALKNPGVAKKIKSYKHFQNQLDWIRIPGNPNITLDFIGHFESFSDDSAHVMNDLGVHSALGHKRKSKKSAVFSTEMIDIVADMYSEDIDILGYSGQEPI
tara:strand:+ start:203 stop:919 length:717 start_codon:yes stop_codon:yes gene_type:complete